MTSCPQYCRDEEVDMYLFQWRKFGYLRVSIPIKSEQEFAKLLEIRHKENRYSLLFLFSIASWMMLKNDVYVMKQNMGATGHPSIRRRWFSPRHSLFWKKKTFIGYVVHSQLTKVDDRH